MFLEFPGTVSVDKKPMIENLKLNIQPLKRKLRTKFAVILDEEKIPIDIVVYRWESKIEKLKFVITIDGKEMGDGIDLFCRISYDIFKSRSNVSCKIGAKVINATIENSYDLLVLLEELILVKGELQKIKK